MAKKNGNTAIDEAATIKATDQAQIDLSKVMDELLNDGGEWEEGSASQPITGRLGVLQRMVTAVADDREYRQILLLGAFDDKQEALLVADAIDERERYGVSIRPILNRVICQCAVNADRMQRVLTSMSQHVLTTQYNNKPGSQGWRQGKESSGILS